MNSASSYKLTFEWNCRALPMMAKAAAAAPADTNRPIWLKTQELPDEALATAIMKHLVPAEKTYRIIFSGFGKLRAELVSVNNRELVTVMGRLGRAECDSFLQHCMADIPKQESVLKLTVDDIRGSPWCAEWPTDPLPSEMSRFFTA